MNLKFLPLLCLALPVSVLAQGSLTPPGAPAPTLKTLQQVEPRKPIDATNTPGDVSSVFKITASGSYYLTGSITSVGGKNGIIVEANNVTIDLNGFSIIGTGAGSLDGIHLNQAGARLTVRNGNIFNWGEDGVDEVDDGTGEGIYENVRSSGNGGDGLRLNQKCVLTACKLDQNGVHGVSVNGRATIKDCNASDNGGSGFLFGAGSILDSVASTNSGSGIESGDEPVLIKNCVAFQNGNTGLRSGGGGKVIDCISRNNSNQGIDAGSYTTVTNCTVKNNSTGINATGSCQIVGNLAEGNGTGIEASSDKNVIDGNQVIQGATGGTGILVTTGSTRNLIIRNKVGNYTPNYDIPSDNRYGPIIDVTAPGTAPASGNSAASTLTAAALDPWANFSF